MMNSLFRTTATLSLVFAWVLSVHAQFAGPHIVGQTENNLGAHFYADLDGDGLTDLLTNQGNLWWQKNDGSGHFGSKQLIAGANLYSYDELLTADMNNDGSIDLVYQNTAGFCWQANDGLGNFGTPNFIGTEPYTESYAAGDVDNDGDQDLVVFGSLNGSNITLYWQENTGAGSFNLHVIEGNLNCCSKLKLIDFNGDNHLDILYADNFGSISGRTNNGSEQFGGSTLIFSHPNYTIDFVPSDVNQDGYVDIILVGVFQIGDQLSWVASYGGGAFATIAQPIFTGQATDFLVDSHVAFADLNGDAILDIAGVERVNTTDFKLATFINQGNTSGFFNFTQTPVSPIPSFVPKAADLNGDGSDDLSLQIGNSLYSSLSNTDGTLMPLTRFYSVLRGVNSLDVADLNNDSAPDLLITTQGVDGVPTIYPNDGQGHFGPDQILGYELFSGDKALAGDVDQDGDEDLIGSTTNQQLYWRRNDGNGVFSAPILLGTGYKPFYLSHLNNDAYADLIVVAPDTYEWGWLAGTGNGSFSAFQSLGFPQYAEYVSSPADLDGDGDLDLATATNGEQYWFENDGNGAFPNSHLVDNLSSFLRTPIPVDLDGDGDMDLLCGGDQVKWYENLGGGSYDPTAHQVIDPQEPFQPEAGDFDNDGDMDLLLHPSDSSYAKLIYFENQGTGTFGPANVFGPTGLYAECKLRDLDGDGDLDFAYFSPYSDKFGWFENLSSAAFIQGSCFLDVNENGIWNVGEPPLLKVALSLSPASLASFVNSAGDFRFYIGQGNYTLSYVQDDCFTLTTPSPSYNINFTGATVTGPLFGFKRNNTDRHVKPQLSSNPPRCASDVIFRVSLDNNFCNDAAGKVALVTDALAPYVSADLTPAAINGDTIWWNYDTVAAGSVNQIEVILHVADASHVGDTIHLRGFTWIDQPNGSYTLSDSGAYWTVIRCSFDPNDKTVDRTSVPLNYLPEENELVYTIRFQNTGNDTAFTVRLRDTLSPDLDWATLRPLGSSSPYYVVLNTATGLLEFDFAQINLTDTLTNEPGSHGFVQFAIQLNPGLPGGSLVHNRAGIYFDANQPVMTTTAETRVLLESATHAPLQKPMLTVMPNPTSGLCKIQFDRPVGKNAVLTLNDMQGRVLRRWGLASGILEQSIDLDGLPAGMYFMQLEQTGQARIVSKLVKQ